MRKDGGEGTAGQESCDPVAAVRAGRVNVHVRLDRFRLDKIQPDGYF